MLTYVAQALLPVLKHPSRESKHRQECRCHTSVGPKSSRRYSATISKVGSDRQSVWKKKEPGLLRPRLGERRITTSLAISRHHHCRYHAGMGYGEWCGSQPRVWWNFRWDELRQSAQSPATGSLRHILWLRSHRSC